MVLDSSEHPLAGAVVVAVPQHPQNDIDQSRTTTTDQYGQFVLHGLANIPYDVYAWDEISEGAYHDPEFLTDFAGSAVAINIGSGIRSRVNCTPPSPMRSNLWPGEWMDGDKTCWCDLHGGCDAPGCDSRTEVRPGC